MPYAFKDLMAPTNQASGIAEVAFLCPVKDFDPAGGIKSPVAPFTNPGDEITIAATHEVNTGKGFAKYQLAPQKNSLKIDTRGDIGLQGQNCEATIFLPGSYAQAHEQVKHLLNTPLIGLFKDANCPADLYYQFGCDCMGAYFTGNFTTGTSKDGVKGYEAKIIYDSGVQFYGGTIPFLP